MEATSSRAAAASLKQFFRAHSRLGDAVVGRGSSDKVKGRTTLNMPELLAMASRRKDWKEISAESFLVSPEDNVGQGTELI